MKFSKVLHNEAVPEWRIKYIDYKLLKKRLDLVERARRSEEKELKHSLSNHHATSIHRKSQVSQEDEENQEGHDNNEFSQPPSSSPSPPNASKRTSYQSQSQKQLRFSFNNMAESANTFLHRVSWKLHNISKKQNVPEIQRTQITSLNTMIDELNEEERDFFEALKKELEKIETFYESQETEAIKRFTILQQQFDDLKALKNEKKTAKRSGGEVRSASKKSVKQTIGKTTSMLASLSRNSSLDERVQMIDYKEAKKQIRKAIFEFYRGAKLLDTYRTLNKTGFIKILKEYDKASKRNGYQIYMPRIKNSNFIKSDILHLLIKDVEKYYVKNFEGGSRQRAMKKLRLPDNKHKTFNATSLRVGLYLGMSIPVIFYHEYVFFSRKSSGSLSHSNYALMQLYVGILLPIIMSLLVGINMYIWSQTRINYKFIFEFDPRDNLDFQQYLEIPSIMFLTTNITILLSLLNILAFMSFNSYSLLLLVFFILLLFCPYPTLYYKTRRWFLFAMARQIGCFYYRIEFRDFFIADILTSLSYSFTTIRLLSCSFDRCNDQLSPFIPIFGMIPATIRFVHCLRRYYDTKKSFPHLTNALKYFLLVLPLWSLYGYKSSGGQVLFKAFWIITQILSAFYAFLWDVSMDWSLFDLHSQNYLLRDHLVYSRNWFYYVAIVTNFLLRSTWIFTFIYPESIWVSVSIATGEVMRRCVWNLFRVENEHVNNCGNFRAIKEVPLPFNIEPIQIKIDEEIIARTDSNLIDDMIVDDMIVDDMVVDEKVNQESTNWFLNFINLSQITKNSKKDDWKDFESSKRYDDDNDDDDDDDDDDIDFTESPDQDSERALSRRMVLTRLDDSYTNYASRRIPMYFPY